MHFGEVGAKQVNHPLSHPSELLLTGQGGALYLLKLVRNIQAVRIWGAFCLLELVRTSFLRNATLVRI